MNVNQTLTTNPDIKDEWLDPAAVEIIRRLQSKGFVAYLVGGCVRDLLLNKKPKDFDIVTNATPQEIKKIIPFCFIIGRRFRLVLAKRGEKQFEISTFRKLDDPSVTSSLNAETPVEAEETDLATPEIIKNDNTFGTPEDDAMRRDFTINALFYDPMNKTLRDMTHGLDDLKKGVIRMIGDPDIRLVEDPIRILRALRLSLLIRFSLERSLKQSMIKNAHYLSQTALPRRREEILKWLRLPDPAEAFMMAHDLGILKVLSSQLDEIFCDSVRSELFLNYLGYKKFDTEGSPNDLLNDLAHAFYRAAIENTVEKDIRWNDILENKKLVDWMKNEIGFFKSEQNHFARSLSMISLLKKRKSFEKKSLHRRWTIATNACFETAIRFAQKELLLSPQDIQFWRQAAETAQSMKGERADRSPRRSRRTRQRRSPH